MAKRGYIPTTQEIEGIYQKAIAGDQDAIAQLGDLNNKLSKRANERMRDIERQGLAGTAAYGIAKYWISEQTGGEYFSQSRKLSPDELMETIEASSNYLRSQTSTTAGEQRRRKNILDTLDDRGFFDDISEEGRYTKQEVKKRLLDMFDTDAWEDIRKNNRGGTNEVVAEAVEAIQNGALLGDLKRAFKDFQRNTLKTDYVELWADWTSANKYYKSGSWHELKRSR